MPTGRPSKYTPKIATEICDRLSQGESLRQICRTSKHIPAIQNVMAWLWKYPEFHAQYALARERQAEHMFDEIMDIADDGTNDYIERETEAGNTVTVCDHENINRSRLRVDTRKWFLSKVLPKKYGDKLELEHSGEVSLIEKYKDSSVDDLRDRYAELTGSRSPN